MSGPLGEPTWMDGPQEPTTTASGEAARLGDSELRRWVFNEFGITAEGAWTAEFDRLARALWDNGYNAGRYEANAIALRPGLQRYGLTIEPDDSAYMELDPDGYYVIGDEAEAAIAEARAAALDEARAAVEATVEKGYFHPMTDRALAAIDALREAVKGLADVAAGRVTEWHDDDATTPAEDEEGRT